MNRLKIALFEPSRVVKGGGQKAAADIAAHLSESHDVTVFTQRIPEKDLNFGNAKIKYIRPYNRFLAPIAFLINKVRGFDLHIVGGFPSNFASVRNKPCLTICYSPTRVFYDLKEHLWETSNWKGRLKILIKNLFLRQIDLIAAKETTKILAISGAVQRRVSKYYGRKADVFYIGITPEKFREGNYDNYILSVCRLVSAKRPELLVKAMGFVKNKDVRLKVCGTGEDKEEIERLCKKYDNVDFLGFVSDEELLNLYANCRAVAYIPIREDQGYAPMEAGASGKATIGANEGGLMETIVDGKTGFLLDDVTPEKIAEKIDFFADNKTAAEEMGRAAKKYAENFHWKSTFPVLDRAIKEIMEMKRKGKIEKV